MDTDQIIHCLMQIERFATMIHSGDTSRSRDAQLAQLTFNAGRFCELAKADGRANWQWLERHIIEGNYGEIAFAAGLMLTNNRALFITEGNDQVLRSFGTVAISQWN